MPSWGIRNWNLKASSRELNVAGFGFNIPGLTLKETTAKDIKRAYRIRAMLVHPDKNRDGRAQEAFLLHATNITLLLLLSKTMLLVATTATANTALH
jgi:hypothetical protein